MTLREAEDWYDWMENHGMTLPIELVPNSRPPRFRWKQTISTPVGDRTIDHEGTLSPTVEDALVKLIALAHQQAQEIIGLRRVNESMARRIESDEAVRSDTQEERETVNTPMGPLPAQRVKKR